MITWIWDNKTWLFDGAGVVVAVGFITWARSRMKSKPNPQDNQRPGTFKLVSTDPPPTSTVVTPCPVSQPTPSVTLELRSVLKQMYDHHNSLPPFQRDDMTKNYVGLRVIFTGKLSNLYKDRSDPNIVILTLRDPDAPLSSTVFVETSISNCPELKITQEGSLITVIGTLGFNATASVQLSGVSIISIRAKPDPDSKPTA